MPTESIIFADLGNSNAKFLLPDGDFLRKNYTDTMFGEILSPFDRENTKIVYSSVNISAEKQLNLRANTINAQKILDNTNVFDFQDIKGMGADRLFGLAGALSQSNPPLITIDCGTAVTVNVLNSEKKVLGGLIMPGIKLREYALRNRTTGLSDIKISPPDKLLGNDTDSAVSSGIFYGIAGAVNSIVNRIKQEYKETGNYNFFLTGGDSLLILPYLDNSLNIIHDELLVIKGIKYLYEIWLTERKL